MARPSSTSLTRARRLRAWAAFPGAATILVAALVLTSCGPDLRRNPAAVENALDPVRTSIYCLIHGDGDYLYHDTLGYEHQADEEALAQVTAMARNNPSAEVFILHQKQRPGPFLLFGGSDGEFTYYRGGILAGRETYRNANGGTPFETQAALCRRFQANRTAPVTTIVLYFGHELSEVDPDGDEESSMLTVAGLAQGIERLTGGPDRTDLLVLSSCFNGTPYAVATLGPRARVIVASPENLHLSYFNIAPFDHLEAAAPGEGTLAFARRFARHAFERLCAEVQTAVSVSVYDVDGVQPYLRDVDSVDRAAAVPIPGAPGTRCDCADLAPYRRPGMDRGVDVLFRAARFGRSKHRQGHSGWECWGPMAEALEVGSRSETRTAPQPGTETVSETMNAPRENTKKPAETPPDGTPKPPAR